MSKLSQTQAGQAFEFAVARAGQLVLGEENIILESTPQLKAAQDLFERLETEQQLTSMEAGRAAMQKLVQFEPHLEDAFNGQSQVWLRFNAKTADPFSKKHNDTRDILIGSQRSEWEIGLVAKHRHEALRNSRLSQKIDFGHEWLGIPCSRQYFQEVSPLFERLERLRNEGAEWNALSDKNETVYIPLLSAFRNELLALDRDNPLMVAPALIRYLIGDYDYYRIIQHDAATTIDVFNFGGTLNASSTRDPNVRLRKLDLPNKLVDLYFAKQEKNPTLTSSTTLTLVCDAGWMVSFRLHNARKLVEPSLKFDIKLIKTPEGLQSFSLHR